MRRVRFFDSTAVAMSGFVATLSSGACGRSATITDLASAKGQAATAGPADKAKAIGASRARI
jgi:hypothetical protein